MLCKRFSKLICCCEFCDGRIKCNPRSMDHLCVPSPWTPSWTRSMDYPRGLPSIFENEFSPEV